MNSGVTSGFDFVGAYDVLYMKLAKMATDAGEGVRSGTVFGGS
jgi:hypothetical protein